MRHSLACLQKSRTSPSPAIEPPSAMLQVCACCVFQILSRAEEANNMYNSETLTNKHARVLMYVLACQDLQQQLQGVFQIFLCVLVCLSHSNCHAVWACLRA